MLTHRKTKGSPFTHFGLFDAENWGLGVYDEVHLLPAPVFRAVASIQARRRLGLTATLVREDGRQGDVFAPIGPKRFDVPWRSLEHTGWIAEAACVEVRVAMNRSERLEYAGADDRERYRLASTIPEKMRVVDSIMARHAGERVLVLGMYLDQLRGAGSHQCPPITGGDLSSGAGPLVCGLPRWSIQTLVISRVGPAWTCRVRWPSRSVVAGVSREEEAQRSGTRAPSCCTTIGRFYTVVTRESVEQKFAERRQRFLAEQGYRYAIETWDGERTPSGSRRDRWAQCVVHRDVTVLAVREPGVLDEIRAVVPLDEFVLAVISDTRLLLDPTRLAEPKNDSRRQVSRR